MGFFKVFFGVFFVQSWTVMRLGGIWQVYCICPRRGATLS